MKNNYQTKILKKLANLPFAIGLLITIGILIAIGTVIEQDQSLSFYKENYPEGSPVFGFLTWKLITFLNFNAVYSAWWFVAILLLFVSSLLACTFTTQLPGLKTFKLWKFLGATRQFTNLNLKDTVTPNLSNSFAYTCNDNQYSVFRQNKASYAYCGILGRLAPVIVHGSIVLLLLGSTIGSFSGYIAQEIIPRGEIVHIQNIIKSGDLSYLPQGISCRINDFWITYTKELKIDQFYSDLSLLDNKGYELKRKTIFVNEPLVYDGLTFYQTDWDIIGFKVKLDNDKIIQIPLKKITKGGRKFWFGSFKAEDENLPQLSFVLDNLKGEIAVYDEKGVFLKKENIGDTFMINNKANFQFIDFITSTGLQIKSDPGISTVYFSFLLLMVSIYVSFLTYSQLWTLENKESLFVAGTSNRAVLFFQEEFRKFVNKTRNQLN